jgi:ferritin-like metal-binding protein YciE
MKTLESLFLDELADIYDAENRLTKALPKMAKAATNAGLREAIEEHVVETEGQLERLQAVFKEFGKSAKGKKCEAIEGLIKEADSIASENKGSRTIDAALISAAQKVEHYEIASYGCLREWASRLGNEEAVSLLQETLNEEKAADKKLTGLARECANAAAEQSESEEEETASGLNRLSSRRQPGQTASRSRRS